MKQSREKLLLYAILGVVALWQGPALFDSFFLKPVRERREQLSAAEGRVYKLSNIEKRKLENARKKLKDSENRSLPPVPVVAQSQYQPWLIDLATKSKLTDVAVEGLTGSPRSIGDTYYVISATVKARGTLDKICDFLHAFHQSGLLHRVTGVSLESAKHEGNPVLDATIMVEGLALKNSPARKTLFVDASAPPKPARSLKERQAYDSITAKNLFVVTRPVVKGPAKSPVEALPDTAAFVFLVASVASGTNRDATLFDRTSAKETKLTPGAEFSVPGMSGKVVAISDDHIVVEYQGEQWLLDLGKNLRQMRKP